MRDVYAGCYVCLAASSSTDSNGGLLVQDYRQAPFVASFECGGVEPFREFAISHRVSSEFQYFGSVSQSPLNERAWVLQEMILSDRVIHFAKDQIWWECHARAYAEIMATSHMDQTGSEMSSASEAVSVFISSAISRNAFDTGDWETLVSSYNKRSLTFEKDRLAALAGIAEAFASLHHLSSHDYLAGLWRPCLEEQILWSPLIPITQYHSPVLSASTAPSWSWASCGTASGVYPLGSEREKVTFNSTFAVLHAEVSTVGPSPFSTVLSGMLYLKGTILPAWYTKKDVDNSDSITLDTEPGPTRAIPYSTVLVPIRRTTHAIQVCHPKSTNFGSYYTLYLLRPVAGLKGTYTRTGCYFAKVAMRGSSDSTWLTSRTKLSEKQYLEDFGDGVYKIAII